jgi:hypothetical protein
MFFESVAELMVTEAKRRGGLFLVEAGIAHGGG